ncbi:MAG: hypothetical protein N2490_05780 [Ignavibacteria bacterium]|nr:hypothetical protein [Ignavibacteria bacterium]
MIKKIPTYKNFFLLLIIFSFLIVIDFTYSQNFNFRINTYFYSFERYDSIKSTSEKSSEKFVKGYQTVLIDISHKKWSFNTSLQTEEDVIGKTGKGFDFRFYSAYFKGNDIFNLIDIKLGRQYFSAGVGRGTIDGMLFKVKLGNEKHLQIKGYIGANTPVSYNFNDYGKISENFSLGTQFSYFGIEPLSLSLSYFLKRSKPKPFYTVRPDSIFNPKQVLIDIDAFENNLAGFDLDYSKRNYSFAGKLYFDLSKKNFYKIELNASYNFIEYLKISTGYLYRKPLISYNSIFWVFNQRQIQELEIGLDYIWNENYNFYARLANVFYEDDNSLKISCGLSHPAYGISFVKYSGYAGESDGIYGYFNYDIISKILSITTGVNFSRYRLDNYIDSKENAFAGIVGIVYRPINRLNFDLQGQFIKNRIYKFDTRILLGCNYWLFIRM